MPDDHFATADCMYYDSQYLHQRQRWHNACYLAGYVVECALKAIAIKRGFDPDNLRKKRFGHRLQPLLDL